MAARTATLTELRPYSVDGQVPVTREGEAHIPSMNLKVQHTGFRHVTPA